MTLKKNFETAINAIKFKKEIESFIGKTLKSVNYANIEIKQVKIITVSAELKDSAPDQDYNYVLKMFQ